MGSRERSNESKISPAETEVAPTEKKDSLFEYAMKNNWDEVVRKYAKEGNARREKITKAEDTVLHLAVCYELTNRVVSMVESLRDGDEAKEILGLTNKKGNTALHLAAIAGDVNMCRIMVKKHAGLTRLRNKENETPLFSAARHGNNSAFLYLLKHLPGGHADLSLCRKKQGDTILHAAISGEYLDLAIQIVKWKRELANCVNENGQTPLHILATKPNLFKSSFRFRHLDYLIYPCILIDELQERRDHPSSKQKEANDESQAYPQNYQTCMSLFRILRKALETIIAVEKKGDVENPETENKKKPDQAKGEKPKKPDPYQSLFPANYATAVQYFKLSVKALLIVLGLGISRMQTIIEIKTSHKRAYQLMKELVEGASSYQYDDNGGAPKDSDPPLDNPYMAAPSPKQSEKGVIVEEKGILIAANKLGVVEKILNVDCSNKDAVQPAVPSTKQSGEETAILIAAKKGIVEVVERILEMFPVAIQDVDRDNKNVVLLAVEHRQPAVYQFLLQRKIMKDHAVHQVDSQAFHQVDKEGNSALHLASIAGTHKPWFIPGAALQMQWELKWYKFVKRSMPAQTFVTYNNKGQTAEDAFRATHGELIMKGSDWLTKTSESFSVVAALIATVAFSTSANIPGGVKEGTGTPNLKNQPAFNVFAVSSVIALCCSVTALVFFLAILTSRFQEKNFARDLPRKLLIGLTALFTSVAAILVSFCAGHFYVLGDLVRNAAYPIYAVTCFPVTFFVLAQLPLYFDLVLAIFSKVPTNSYQDFPE